ncbi:MAG: CotH kinase family protein [Coprobacter sp.]|nr:CotH kinase family protein [Coprobacter sp.]
MTKYKFFICVLIIINTFSCIDKSNIYNTDTENLEDSIPLVFSLKIGDATAIQTDKNIFHIQLPYYTNVKELSPQINTNSTYIALKKGAHIHLNIDTVDFSNPITFILKSNSGKYIEYKVIAHYSNLPIIYLTTPSTITSKEIWTENCIMEIYNAGTANGVYEKVNVKGRGNTTWTMPKKPYAIKLYQKADILGLPKHKHWVLLANYFDTSLLRNEISFYMGRISDMDYTPRSRFVELVMNGEYQGLYQLTEKLKIDENRINIGNDGFLLEIDARAGENTNDIYFETPHIRYPLVIKEPDVIREDEEYTYIKQYITAVENILFGDSYTDPENGYRKYLNVESFVDWYLINEITKNADANFKTSCFMHLKKGEKLQMGPLWDYDLALANYVFEDIYKTTFNEPEGFHIKNVSWYDRLFSDPYFSEQVKKRFNYYYENRQLIYHELQFQKKIINTAIAGNEWRWNHFNVNGNITLLYENHTAEIIKIQTWLEKRFQWLKTQFDTRTIHSDTE